jgi:Putative adhesin
VNRRSRPRSAAARLSLVVGGVLIGGVVLTGCGSADADDAEPEYKSFSLPGRELTVDSDNSEIELVPGDAKDVKVTRWFAGWTVGGSSSASWSVDGSTLKLREDCDGISSHCESKHKIEVPRGVTVTVKDHNGTVRARGFDTDLKVTTHNGEIKVTDATGALDLSSSNGNVTATGVGSRKVKAGSHNGNVRLALGRVPDRVEATDDNGNVTVELPRASYKVDASSDNGNAKVDVPRDDVSGHTVSGRSHNGNVKVVIAN